MENNNELNFRNSRINEEDISLERPARRERRNTLNDNQNEIDEKVDEILIKMEETLHSARKVPLSDQCIVDREEMCYWIDVIREKLPEELRQAKWLLQHNKQLIAESRKEAESILSDAEIKMARMIDEHEITQQAKIEAQRIVDNANTQSRQIQSSTMDYVKNNLEDLEEQLTEMLVYIQKNKKELDI